MTGEMSPSSIASMFVVLDDSGEATPIAYRDRFYEDLERKFGNWHSVVHRRHNCIVQHIRI